LDPYLTEKKLVPGWDILLMSTKALFLENTPAFIHREVLGRSGKFRASPLQIEFEGLYQKMTQETNRTKRLNISAEIDRLVYEKSLALFLCSPQALYAVNRHVLFQPYRTSFELAETSVTAEYWSRRPPFLG
jgi:peptide/nickel transport system substrate-binding protein